MPCAPTASRTASASVRLLKDRNARFSCSAVGLAGSFCRTANCLWLVIGWDRRNSARDLRKRPWHDFRRADATQVFQDQLQRFVHVVSQGEQIEVARADELVMFLHLRFHPADQAGPELFAEQDQRKARNAPGLHQRDHLEKLVERAKAAGHENERGTVLHEADLARKEIVEM